VRNKKLEEDPYFSVHCEGTVFDHLKILLPRTNFLTGILLSPNMLHHTDGKLGRKSMLQKKLTPGSLIRHSLYVDKSIPRGTPFENTYAASTSNLSGAGSF